MSPQTVAMILKLGQTRCQVEHVGLVVAGAATAAFADGRVIEMRAGDLAQWARSGRPVRRDRVSGAP